MTFRGKNRLILGVLAALCLAAVLPGCGRFRPRRHLAICEAQGPGQISPYLSQEVTLEGTVTLDLEDQAVSSFFLQEDYCPEALIGSRGILAVHPHPQDAVQQGDQVRVAGVIRESGGETRLEINPDGVKILGQGVAPMPVPLGLSFRGPLADLNYEVWEGMLVIIPESRLEANEVEGKVWVEPRLHLAPDLQLVCIRDEVYRLQLLSNLTSGKFPVSGSSNTVQDIVGVLRQDLGGYGLYLAGETNLRVLNTGPDNLTGGGPADQTNSGVTPRPSGDPETITSTPAIYLTASPTAAPATQAIPTFYPVPLLISEFLPNPPGKEPDGEWIEIYNPAAARLPLTGIKLGDETSPGGKEGLVSFPEGSFIPAGGVLVIAQKASTFVSRYGFLPDFEFTESDPRVPVMVPVPEWGGSRVQLSNSGDEVVLVDPWGNIKDLVAYGSGSGPGFQDPPDAPPENHSLERYPPERDTGRGSDWRVREPGSPGKLDRSPPTQPASPTAAPTGTASLTPTAGNTFSPSPSATGTPASTSTQTGTSTPGSSPAPSSTISLTPSPSQAGTLPPSPTLFISSTSRPTALPTHTPGWTGTPSQTLTFTITPVLTPSSTSPDPGTHTATPGSTPTLDRTPTIPGTVTQSPTEFISLTPTPESSTTAAPSATVSPTPIYLESDLILVNEIHADPDPQLGDANQDGEVSSDDDEFVELINPGPDDLDLSGWVLGDSVRDRFTFPDGTVLVSGCALVVFGGGEPGGDFGGSLVFHAGSLGLNNGGDIFWLRNSSGAEILRYPFGDEGGQNQALARSPDVIGPLPLVLHSLAPGAGGALYSPGTRLDGASFDSCP